MFLIAGDHMNQKPFRVTFFSLEDTWCRYFDVLGDAVAFMQEKESLGFRVILTNVPEI